MRSTSAKIVKKNPITITLLFKLKKLEELSKDSKLFKNIAKKFLTSQNKENLWYLPVIMYHQYLKMKQIDV